MSKEVVIVLRAARAVIEDKTHWTKDYWARNAAGLSTMPTLPDARAWCAAGVVELVCARTPELVHFYSASIQSLIDTAGVSITTFNDEHTHAEVLALFGKAITSEEEKANARSAVE